jgi:hypothetical protein
MGRIERYENAEAAKALTANEQKFGSNVGIGTSFEDIWEIQADYNFLSTAATLYMGSSSASDTAVTVTVEGLDANWDYQKIEVALDATDPQADQVAVITASGSETWIRVNRAWVSGVTAAVGNIYIADEVPGTWGAGGLPGTIGNTVAYIPIADQQTMQAVYSMPRNQVGALVSWQVSNSTAQSSQAKIEVREFGGVFRTKSTVIGIANETFQKVWYTYPKLFPKCDIKIAAKADAATADFTGEFDIYTHI